VADAGVGTDGDKGVTGLHSPLPKRDTHRLCAQELIKRLRGSSFRSTITGSMTMRLLTVVIGVQTVCFLFAASWTLMQETCPVGT
jgi:hypothetical protein